MTNFNLQACYSGEKKRKEEGFKKQDLIISPANRNNSTSLLGLINFEYQTKIASEPNLFDIYLSDEQSINLKTLMYQHEDSVCMSDTI